MPELPFYFNREGTPTLTTPHPNASCEDNHDAITTTSSIPTQAPSRSPVSEYQLLSSPALVVETEDPIRARRSSEPRSKAPEPQGNVPHSFPISSQTRAWRTSLGRPGPPCRHYHGARKRKFSARDDDDSSSSDTADSENDSASDSEYEGDDSSSSRQPNPPNDAYYILPADHEYQIVRKGAVQFIYGRLRVWVISVRYIIPPVHRIRNRRKRTKRIMYIEEADPNDPNVVIISAFHGYYHLACPFYIFNTVRHRKCALQHSLRSIEDVVEHIEHHHVEPPFCHICGKLFDGFKSRNDHIRRDVCDRRDDIELDGANFYQRARIIKRDDPDLNEGDRWRRIYSTLFGCKPSVSPYLTQGEGLKFSLLHDYWASNGESCVRQYLSDHGYSEGHLEDNSREVKALCSLVFEDLENMIEGEQEGVSWE